MIDVETYGAAVGAAKRYTDEHSGSDDAVKYTEQDLTSEQQAQARENIGAAASDDIPTDAVKYTAQTLTNAQKTQARTNIGAAAADDDNKLRLGQMFDLSNTNPYGFYSYYYGTSLKIVEFSSVEVRNKVSTAKQVGDFVLYKTGNSSSTDKMVFAPIAGRTAGKALTGAWVKAECLYELFNNCSGLISIDLSPVDTSAVRDITRMFYKCTSLTTLDLSSFDMTNVVAYTDMFGDSSNPAGIITLKTPKINPHDDIPLPRTLYSQDGTAYTNLPVTTGTSIELRVSWT
jgi:surface protein